MENVSIIKGAKYYDDRDHFYVQTNNPTEIILSKVTGEPQLETCGPSSAINCIAPMGHSVDIRCPGKYKPQPEEVLSDCLNDPRYSSQFQRIRQGIAHIPGNRVPQFYPYVVKEVFGVSGRFTWLSDIAELIDPISEGRACQVCLLSPGHYIAFVAYDYTKQEFIYNDSWPARIGGDGFNVRMPLQAARDELQKFAIIYGG